MVLTDKGVHTDKTAGKLSSPPNGLDALLAACINNDRIAQRKLYDTYASMVYGIIRRYTSDEATAQDIQSEAFYRIFKRLEQYRFEGAFEGWMRRIAVHAVADHFRKHKPENIPLTEATGDIPAYNDSGGISGLAYKELLALIHELPTTQRTVFNLFVFEQLSHKEIANLLGISENNSRWHLNDARRRLKERIINHR